MGRRHEGVILAGTIALLLGAWFLPVGNPRFDNAVLESLALLRWYAREHVLLCLLPAFFIAGAVAVFVNQGAVMRYLGPAAPKALAYGVAAISGGILAVCSCTVLPLFAGIHRRGAGLGPASAFLYSGPAINVLAIVLTMRVLGLRLGIARAIGAVLFSVVIGLLMHLLFRREEEERAGVAVPPPTEDARPLWQTGLYFASMVAVLVFANWGRPMESTGPWAAVYELKWTLTAAAGLLLLLTLGLWLGASWRRIGVAALLPLAVGLLLPGRVPLAFGAALLGIVIVTFGRDPELRDWRTQSWGFAKQILPLLGAGVLIAGLLLGRPGGEGWIPSSWVASSVGGNSLGANLFASVAGAFMYFATLTEVPILEGLLGNGMGQGPALALLLAGPALSLPNMLVIRSVLGTKRTLAYIGLVVVMSTVAGLLFGTLYPGEGP